MKGGSGNSVLLVMFAFVNERPALNGKLTAVRVIDFGNYAVQIQDTIFMYFLSGTTMETLDTQSLYPSARFTQLTCNLINFGNKRQLKT